MSNKFEKAEVLKNMLGKTHAIISYFRDRPRNFFKIFEEISKQNKCSEFKHLETLAFLIGTKNSSNEIRASVKGRNKKQYGIAC